MPDARALPPGTRVVTTVEKTPTGGGQACPAGIVGVIVKKSTSSGESYRVRCANGFDIDVKSDEIERLVDVKIAGLGGINALNQDQLHDHIILRCVAGSRAYGLEQDGSDTDLRGVYLAPLDLFWSLHGAPPQVENDETQECYWELQKFLTLALKANPNVLECLYTPSIELVTPLGKELLELRDAFLSTLVYQTFNGYAISQFRKIGQDLRTTGRVKWKHAMHLIRLLLSGIGVLQEGVLTVCVTGHRDRLLAIRRGEVDWEEVDAWRLELHDKFDKAYQHTELPTHPDYERVNEFLIRARRSVI